MATQSTSPSEISVIGVDIGKDVFHLVGFDADGKIILRKQIKRLALVPTFEKLPPLYRRDGSLPECAFREPYAAQAWLQAKDYPGDLREAILEGPEERLQ